MTEVLGVIPKTHYAFWRRRVGTTEADAKTLQAQTFGTHVHAVAARIARDESERVFVPEMFPYEEAIRDFMRMHVAEAIVVERALVSERHRFGGTLDLYCRLTDGSYAVVDYKTTTSLTREHGLQVAAYALLCREQGWPVNKRMVVRIKKDAPGRFYARVYGDHRGDVEAFLALKTYWHWLHRSKLEKAA